VVPVWTPLLADCADRPGGPRRGRPGRLAGGRVPGRRPRGGGRVAERDTAADAGRFRGAFLEPVHRRAHV